MGDVLPPKRDTVERLRRRINLYRAHHNSCLPRYEQATNNIRDAERQETLLLRQRFLESKAKKAKNKSEHHRTYKEAVSDSNKAQMAKPVKRSAEESICSGQSQSTNGEDTEKPSKIARTETLPDKKPELKLQQQTCLGASLQTQQSSQQTSTLPTFSVQIVQKFSSQQSTINPAVQTNVTVQNLPKPLNSPLAQVSNQTECNQDENSQSTRNSAVIECKQEQDIDISHSVETSNGANSCDLLSDTFPSIGVNDDSGVDILPPEVLHDLIADMTENPDYPYLMTAFFDDNVESMKDQENDAKDILDLVKDAPSSFQSDNVPLVPPTNEQQLNGLFRNFSGGNETPVSTMSAPALTTSSLYNQPAQRLPPSYLNTGMDCLRFDYKMTEPTGSLAARTLKQLAEQHQSLQQQQVFNKPLSGRPPFNQDNHYVNQANHHSPNFLTGASAVSQNNEKTANAYTLDRLSEELFGSLPANCEQLSPSNRFDVAKQRVSEASTQQMEQQQKPPPYSTAHFAPENSSSNLPSSPLENRQVQSSSDLRFQLQGQLGHLSPQGHSDEFKQQQLNKLQPHSNLYNNYSQQQSSANPPFQMSISQSLSVSQSLTYSSQFSPTLNKPPPEYKSHHHSLLPGNLNLVEQPNGLPQPSYSQTNKTTNKLLRSPNVTIAPDGSALPSSHDWRLNITNIQQSLPHQNQFRTNLSNFGNFVTSVPTAGAPLSPLYNQHKMSGYQMPMPRNQMLMPGNQMPVPRNQMPLSENQIPGPRSQMPVPRSQMQGPRNQMQGPRNQMQGPRNQVQGPRSMSVLGNQMPGPRNQMPASPGAQMPGPRTRMTGPRNQIPLPRNQSGPVNQMPLPGNQISGNRLSRPNMMPVSAIMMQQQQRMGSSQCQRSPTMTSFEQHSSMKMNNSSMSPNRTLSPMGPIGPYAGPKDIIRNDGTISPMNQLGPYAGSKEIIRNDGAISPMGSLGSYAGPKDVIRNDGALSPMSPIGPYAGPKDITNRNNSGHINLDIFDNTQYLFDLSDIV